MRGYQEICWNGITCIIASPLAAGASGGRAAPNPLSASANRSNDSDSSGSASGAALTFIRVAVVETVEAGGEAAAAESVVTEAMVRAAVVVVVMVPLLLSSAAVEEAVVAPCWPLAANIRALRAEPEEEVEANWRPAVTELELPRTVSCMQHRRSTHQRSCRYRYQCKG